MPSDKTLLGASVIGALISALCCFTPVLYLLLGVVGLSALTGYIDYVVLPALAAFVALAAYELFHRRRAGR